MSQFKQHPKSYVVIHLRLSTICAIGFVIGSVVYWLKHFFAAAPRRFLDVTLSISRTGNFNLQSHSATANLAFKNRQLYPKFL